MPLLVLVVIAALALPAVAGAQRPTNSAPGNSALDQYSESVPGASGDKRPGRAGGRLTPTGRRGLERRGRDGRALAEIIDATAESERGSDRVTSKSKRRATALVAAEGRSPLRVAAATATGAGESGGLGILLPLLLGAITLVILATVILRRRAAKA